MSAFNDPSLNDAGVQLEDEFAPQRLLFASCVIILCGSVFYRYFKDTVLPYTVVVFIFGILLGLLSSVPGFVEFGSVFKNFTSLPPKMLFMIFLPVLIFEGAYGIRTHALTRVVPAAILFATVGLMINTFMVGAALKLMVGDDINWYAAVLLGSVLSATDPVAVVALLKSLGVDAGLTAVIDGEAIMNDGTAIITYVLVFPAAVAGAWETSNAELIASIFQLTVGAIFLGLAFGFLMHKVLRACEGDDLMFAIITIAFTFIIYFVADVVCETSGVLTLFFSGVYLARSYPSHFPGKAHSILQVTFEFFVSSLNTLLFCMVGIIVARQAIATMSMWTVFLMIYMHIMCCLCRTIMLVILWPLANLIGSYQLNWRTLVVASHGGLKGGVATILTLVIVSSGALSNEVTQLFLQVNLGCVLLSLMTNATTAGAIVKYLKLQAKPKHSLMQMAVGKKRLDSIVNDALHRTTMIPTYRKAHFPRIKKLVESIENPYGEVLSIEETDMDCFKNLLMRVVKSEIWNLRDTDRLSEDATCLLTGTLQTRPANSLLDVASFFDSELKYPSWIGHGETFSNMLGGFLQEQVLEWRFNHDLTLFESLVAFNFILDSLDRIIPDIATSDELLKFGNDYITYQRKKIDQAIDSMQREHPTIMASVITEIAAHRVMHAAHHAAHGDLDCGFSQRDTASLMEAVHHVVHQIRDLPIDIEAVSAQNVLPISRLCEGVYSETILRLQRECKTFTVKADEYIKLPSKDILLIIVGSAASSRNIRELSKSTVSIDTLVVGSTYGSQCHVTPAVVNDDIIALTEVTYAILPGATVEDLLTLDMKFADNVRRIGAANMSWLACRSLMRESMLPRYSKVDAYYACQKGRLIDVGSDSALEELNESGAKNLSLDFFFLNGADASGTVKKGITGPFLVPRSAQFAWKRGTLLYAVDFSLAKGAMIEMHNSGQHLGSDTDDDDDEGEYNYEVNHSSSAAEDQQQQQQHITGYRNNGQGGKLHIDDEATHGTELTTSSAIATSPSKKRSRADAPRAFGLVYEPAHHSSRIPFVTHGQLELLLCIERLQFLARNFASQRLSAEKRQFLESEVTHTLSRLIQTCGSLFPAEAAVYRIVMRVGVADDDEEAATAMSLLFRAPQWSRPEGTGTGVQAPPLVASHGSASPLGGGASSTNTQQDSSPSKWGALRKKSAQLLHIRQKQLFLQTLANQQQEHQNTNSNNSSTTAAKSSAAASGAYGDNLEAQITPLSHEDIRILNTHIEEHEAFMSYVANFVSGQTSRLVAKKKATESFAGAPEQKLVRNSSISGANKFAAVASAAFQKKKANENTEQEQIAANLDAEIPSAVGLNQFLRVARGFINQHCAGDRVASDIVVKVLGENVVQSLSSAQRAMGFWQSWAVSASTAAESSS